MMSILHGVLDLIFPPRCPVCRDFLWKTEKRADPESHAICRSCLDGFREVAAPLCPRCGLPLAAWIEENHYCENCLRRRPLYEWARAAYFYEGSVREAIHQLKFAGKSHLAGPLGKLLASATEDWLPDSNDDLIMPVPLHPRRLRERGFNQSLLLARQAAARLGAELDYLSLRRVRYTKPQTGLKGDERRKNVRKAFSCTDHSPLKGKNVILVDDVTTTGNTLNECARALKRSGAKHVYGIALARTSPRALR
jgi:ComF family protein